ncbi:hypothetical protein [Pseudomonas phage LUZ7]|uniref:Uncharacterized protein n=1 Tax=Pseudomonas phage LUZ7 TaxID=655097 RepID=C8ZKF0_9CAUD|nr:hypothetical protein PP-LUZ7_gp030 [Pseudomonas phage LUZ7]CAZ66171.1 hypothetical protein [Pseudomonas phage LUZ7]
MIKVFIPFLNQYRQAREIRVLEDLLKQMRHRFHDAQDERDSLADRVRSTYARLEDKRIQLEDLERKLKSAERLSRRVMEANKELSEQLKDVVAERDRYVKEAQAKKPLTEDMVSLMALINTLKNAHTTAQRVPTQRNHEQFVMAATNVALQAKKV